MRYIVRLSLLLLLSHSHVWSSELSDVVTTLRESIVELRVVHIDTAGRGTEGFVSGVMVDSTGLILTTAIEPDSRVEIRHSRVEILPGGGFGVAVELLGTSDVFKISVLRTAAAAGRGHVEIASAPAIGSDVLAVGHIRRSPSEAGYFAVSRGIVSSDQALVDDASIPGYHLATDIQASYQQHLLFDARGRLVSVRGLFDTTPGKATGSAYYPVASMPAWIRESLSAGESPAHGGSIGVQLDGPLRLYVGAVLNPDLEQAGLKPGFQLLEAGNEVLRGYPDLKRIVMGARIGESLRILARQESRVIEVQAMVGAKADYVSAPK